MSIQIKNYCEACQICIAAKAKTGKIPGLLTPPAVPKGPFLRIHADTIRCLPESNRLKHVLVVVDSFTKFLFTHPITRLSPLSILDGLIAIFSRFGPPSIFIANNGSEFHSRECLVFSSCGGYTLIFLLLTIRKQMDKQRPVLKSSALDYAPLCGRQLAHQRVTILIRRGLFISHMSPWRTTEVQIL